MQKTYVITSHAFYAPLRRSHIVIIPFPKFENMKKESKPYTAEEFEALLTESNPFKDQRITLKGKYTAAGADRYRCPIELDGYLTMEGQKRLPMHFANFIDISKRPINGDEVEFTGYIKYIDDKEDGIDHFYIFFYVTAVEKTERSELAKSIEAIKNKNKKEIIIEKGQKARICFVAPSKVAYFDVLEGIGDEVKSMNISFCQFLFLNNAEINANIKEIDKQGFNIVCFTRGGGSSFGAFQDPTVMESIAKMKTYTIGAIGHTIDRNVFDIAFDESLGTPSLLGVRLKELCCKF